MLIEIISEESFLEKVKYFGYDRITDIDSLKTIYQIELERAEENYTEIKLCNSSFRRLDHYHEYTRQELIIDYLKHSYSKEKLKTMSDDEIMEIINRKNLCVKVKEDLFILYLPV